MSRYDYDLFTIGAGSGGVAASRRAGALGARTAICESSRVGGTCVMRGCVPKKLLMYGSMYAAHLQDAKGFGWEVGASHLDWARLVEVKDAELNRLEQVYHRMLRDSGVKLESGRGVIIDPHTVEVDGRRITAEHILVATGGWPQLPKIPGIEHAITSNEALELKALPSRMVIVGAGYIGVEFASIFAAAGVSVTMIVRSDGILRGFDRDVREALRQEMESRGVEIRCETRVASIEKTESGLSLRIDPDDFGEILETDLVMYATGRHPNTANLGLESAGVNMRENGSIVVDELSCTNIASIHAVGDVTDRAALTPVAIAEGRALVETLFRGTPTRIDHAQIATAVFTQPPVGTIGMTEAQARADFAHVDIYRARFRPMKHVLSGRRERTLMKMIVDRDSDRVLGCHMVGEDAPEIIQGVAVAFRCGATKTQFDDTMAIHPTAAEELVTMREPVPADD